MPDRQQPDARGPRRDPHEWGEDPTEYLGRAGEDGRTEYMGRAGDAYPTEYLGSGPDADANATRFDYGDVPPADGYSGASEPRGPRSRQVIPPPGQRGESATDPGYQDPAGPAEDYDADRRSGRLERYEEGRRGPGGGVIAVIVLAALALGLLIFFIGRMTSGGEAEPEVETTTQEVTATQVTTVTSEPEERRFQLPTELLSEIPTELPSLDVDNLPELPSLPEELPISQEDARNWWQDILDRLSHAIGNQG